MLNFKQLGIHLLCVQKAKSEEQLILEILAIAKTGISNHKREEEAKRKKAPKVYKAIRRRELENEVREGEGTFLELIELFDEEGKSIAKSNSTHPESYHTMEFEGVEYFSQPHSNGIKPIYHRILEQPTLTFKKVLN